MKDSLRIVALSGALVMLGGCAVMQSNTTPEGEALTAGKVQSEIHKGMTGDQVAIALGSPNIVTSDAEGNTTWIYDRISSHVRSSSSSVYGTLLLIGGESKSYSRSSSQSTFTVVIKFDEKDVVRDFSFHSSRF